MTRGYGHRRPSNVFWTVALVIVILAALRAIYQPLAIAVAVSAILVLIGVAFVRSWNRYVAQRDNEDAWGRRL